MVRGAPWQDVILTALSLAFATIPEELPILITGVLAVGGLALSRRNIFVKNLKAQESLAYVDTLLTDKTGTLTVRNQGKDTSGCGGSLFKTVFSNK